MEPIEEQKNEKFPNFQVTNPIFMVLHINHGQPGFIFFLFRKVLNKI